MCHGFVCRCSRWHQKWRLAWASSGITDCESLLAVIVGKNRVDHVFSEIVWAKQIGGWPPAVGSKGEHGIDDGTTIAKLRRASTGVIGIDQSIGGVDAGGIAECSDSRAHDGI